MSVKISYTVGYSDTSVLDLTITLPFAAGQPSKNAFMQQLLIHISKMVMNGQENELQTLIPKVEDVILVIYDKIPFQVRMKQYIDDVRAARDGKQPELGEITNIVPIGTH